MHNKNILNLDEVKYSLHFQGLKAIWSPDTGIVDWAEVNRSYVDDCRIRGADVYLNFLVKEFAPHTVDGAVSNILVGGRNTVCMILVLINFH